MKTLFNELPQALESIIMRMDKLEGMITELLINYSKPVANSSSSVEPHVFMSLEEAADFVRMKKSTLNDFARKGNVPCTKVGKAYKFVKLKLIAWMEDGGPNKKYEKKNEEILASHRRKPGKNRIKL